VGNQAAKMKAASWRRNESEERLKAVKMKAKKMAKEMA